MLNSIIINLFDLRALLTMRDGGEDDGRGLDADGMLSECDPADGRCLVSLKSRLTSRPRR